MCSDGERVDPNAVPHKVDPATQTAELHITAG